MKPLNETLALAQLYKTRDGLRDNPAYDKAEAVLEIRDELAALPELADRTAAELLRLAEMEYAVGEQALEDHLGTYVPVAHVECRPLLGGFEILQGDKRIFIPSHRVAGVLETMRRSLAADKRAQRVTGKRLARRLESGMARPSFRVVAGRKVETAA